MDKRRNPRIDTSNTVDFILYDNDKNKIGQGKGCTTNLSQSGTLLQTENKLEAAFIILMTIDLDGNKIQVGGKIIASRICDETGSYLTGIEFVGPKEKQRKVIVAFVKAYQRRKNISLES